MPAFSFEKISPPISPGPNRSGSSPVAPIEQKQRGVIVQILGRFVEARVERAAQRFEKGVIARNRRRSMKQD